MPQTNIDVKVTTKGLGDLDRLNASFKKTEKAVEGVTNDIAKFSKSGQKIKTAANGLQYFTDKAGRARKVTGQFVTTAERAAAGIDRVGNASKKASADVGSLTRDIRKLVAGFAVLQTVKAIGQVGIDSIESARRLKALSGAFGEVQAVQLAAARAADKFGLSQREADQAFAQIYARLRPIGIELDQIESAFNGFNTAARLSGTSAQEASAAWLQLSQALGSGVLRGEELNSVFEQTPTVVQAIAREMNVPIGQIRQLAKDGEITSDVVLRALNRLEREGVDQLAEALNGPRQKFKDFSNSVETLSNALARTVLPELTSAISEVGETILLLEGPIKYISGLLSTALGEINSLIRQITKTAGMSARLDIEAGKDPASIISTFTKLDPYAGAKQLFGEEGFKELRAQAEEYAKLRNQNARDVFIDLAQDRLKAMDGDSYIKSGLKAVLPPTTVIDEGKGKGKGKGKGSKTKDPRASDAPQLERDLQLKKELLAIDRSILEAQLAGNAAAVELGQLQRIEAEFAKTKADILASDRYEDEKQLEIANARLQMEDAIQQLEFAGLELDKQRTEAVEGILGPLDEEIQILQGRIAGNEEEIKQKLEILRITKAIKEANPNADTSGVEAMVKQRDALTKFAEKQEEAKAKAEALAGAISGALTDSLRGLVDGSMTAEEALSNAFQGIADAFLDMAMKMIQEWIKMQLIGLVGSLFSPGAPPGAQPGDQFGSLFTGIRGRASGGPVSEGIPYLVGENGPELVVPSSNSQVIPNSAVPFEMGGGNGSSSGLTVPFSNSSSVSRIERSNRETVEAMANPGSLDVKFDSQVINSVEYVTAAQHREGMAQAAERGRQLTLSTMQNSVKTRRRVGI